MKDFFKNKTNIILLSAAIVLGTVGIILGATLFSKPAVMAVDFSTMTQDQLIAWASENGIEDRITYEYEYDENVPVGGIIYQSIKVGEEISDKLLVIISDGPNPEGLIEIPVSTLKTREDAEKWFKDNGFTNYRIEIAKESLLDEGFVVSISKNKAKKDDEIIITVASKANIDVPDFSRMTDEEISNWSKENNVVVKIVYETSTLKKDDFLKQSISAGQKVGEGTTITVSLSDGKGEVSNKKVVIPETYLGIEENNFLANLKELGFTNTKKNPQTYFSVYSKKGMIYSYDSGEHPISDVINYALSEGQYKMNKDDYEDKLVTDVEALAKKYNERNAHIVIKVTKTQTTAHKNNVLYDCSSSFKTPDTTISCKLAQNSSDAGPKEAIIPSSGLLGKTESEFKKALTDIGFKNIELDTTPYYSTVNPAGRVGYYNPEGKQSTTVKITYRLSKGPYWDNFVKSDFEGKTVSQANNVIASYNGENNRNANIEPEVDVSTIKTNAHTANTLYDCSVSHSGNTSKVSCKLAIEETSSKVTVPNFNSNPCSSTNPCYLSNLFFNVTYQFSDTIGVDEIISMSPVAGSQVDPNSTVTVVVSKGPKKYHILPESNYKSALLSSNSISNTKNEMEQLLGMFDLRFEERKDLNLSEGQIISVSVNGVEHYEEGDYPSNTIVIVTISSGLGE